MSYVTPDESIVEYLISEGVLATGEVFLDSMPDFSDLNTQPDLIKVAKMINGDPNPRWMWDDITLVIQIRGYNKTQIQPCKTKIFEIFNKLIGSDNIEINGYIYSRFISPSGFPKFVGYLDDGEPLFTMSISFVREALVAEGNRENIS